MKQDNGSRWGYRKGQGEEVQMTDAPRGVFIECPQCSRQVRVLPGGFVGEHRDASDRPCSFTRTARSGTRHIPPPLSDAEQFALNLRKALVKLQWDAKRNAPRKNRAKCKVCGKQVGFEKSEQKVVAHRGPGKKWCAGGTAPSEQQVRATRSVAQRKSGPSVRTVSGGLPGLGKR